MLNTNSLSPYIRAAVISILKPGSVIHERALFDYELIWLKEGGFRLLMNNTEYEIKQNDIILIPPGTPHTILVNEDSPGALHAHIHFDFVFSEESYLTRVSYKNLEEFTEEELLMIQPDFFEGELEYPYFEISNRKKIIIAIEEIMRFFHAKPALYQLACKEHMINIIRSIVLDNIPETRALDSEGGDFIGSIKSFIDANCLNGKITLDMIAEQFHYNKYYIAKKFNQAYGVSLIKYCNTLRAEYAKQKLIDGISPSHVGELLFFPDVYSFSRFFKSQCGMSPSAYADSVLNEITEE
ncbi:MAG: AraC family transcriptional regulator [Clostridia bacterium]|nr:AraC family transcriptional regulator [Clostridia bacterium]